MNSKDLIINTASYQPPLKQTFTLAGFRVLPELNRLEDQCSGEQMTIEPRLMHLLCFLAANQGKVVERDTLVEQLWPKVIVNENSLTRAVSELRKHLRTSVNGSGSRPVIETISKKGYRLAAPCSSAAKELAAPAIKNTAALSNRNPSWQSPLALSAAFAASLAILAVMSPLPSLAPTTANGIISFTDELIRPQPSYLGGEVKLSANELSMAEQTSTRPVISYDQASFAYIKYDNTGSTLFFGTLSENLDPMPIYHDQDRLLNLAWSPTGDSLLFARKPSMTTTALFSGKGNNLELLAINLATREVQRLIKESVDSDSETLTDQNLT